MVEDKLRTEIEVALAAECNIVPVVDNFQFPAQEELSPAVRAVSYFNCVRWVHDYQDACLDKGRLTIGDRESERGSSEKAKVQEGLERSRAILS